MAILDGQKGARLETERESMKQNRNKYLCLRLEGPVSSNRITKQVEGVRAPAKSRDNSNQRLGTVAGVSSKALQA